MAEVHTVCPDCGAKLPALTACRDVYHELTLYTLSHGQREFIHQHVVDAYAAQHVRKDTKPIALAAALIGLYLFAEKQYSGRQVQQVHMALGNRMKQWPLFPAPKTRATLTVMDALNAAAGLKRDQIICNWARSVWDMWKDRHAEVKELFRSYGFDLQSRKRT